MERGELLSWATTNRAPVYPAANALRTPADQNVLRDPVSRASSECYLPQFQLGSPTCLACFRTNAIVRRDDASEPHHVVSRLSGAQP